MRSYTVRGLLWPLGPKGIRNRGLMYRNRVYWNWFQLVTFVKSKGGYANA